MASWYWYLQIYQRFLRVSTWVLGFWWTKEKAEITFFLVISAFYGLFWTFIGAEGESRTPTSERKPDPEPGVSTPIPPLRREK